MDFDPEFVCRLTVALIFAGTICIGLPHRLRADRAGGRISLGADPLWFWIPMAIGGPVTAAVCLGFLVQPRWVEFAQIDFSPWVRFVGVPFALAGLLLFRGMFRHLGLNVTSTSLPRANAALVTSGPYRLIRHPMYTAALLLVVAVSLLTANAVVVAGGAGMFGLLAARSRLEERRLVEKFGVAYQSYQQDTGRFFPRLRSKSILNRPQR